MNPPNTNNMNNMGPCVKDPNSNMYYRNGVQCEPSYLEQVKSFLPFGGGRRKTVRRGGGFRPYIDQNVASTASRFSGGQTAQPHQWTGGKRRRRTKSKRRSFKCNKCSKRKRHKH
jgi:hypothetical protein